MKNQFVGHRFLKQAKNRVSQGFSTGGKVTPGGKFYLSWG